MALKVPLLILEIKCKLSNAQITPICVYLACFEYFVYPSPHTKYFITRLVI
jgi:hypothetical protein